MSIGGFNKKEQENLRRDDPIVTIVLIGQHCQQVILEYQVQIILLFFYGLFRFLGFGFEGAKSKSFVWIS